MWEVSGLKTLLFLFCIWSYSDIFLTTPETKPMFSLTIFQDTSILSVKDAEWLKHTGLWMRPLVSIQNLTKPLCCVLEEDTYLSHSENKYLSTFFLQNEGHCLHLSNTKTWHIAVFNLKILRALQPQPPSPNSSNNW